MIRPELRRAAAVIRSHGGETRHCPTEAAALLEAIGRANVPAPVERAALALATAMTTVPNGEQLDRRLTEYTRDDIGGNP